MLKGYPVIKSIVNPNVKRHAVITLKIFILLLYHSSSLHFSKTILACCKVFKREPHF